MRAHGWLCTVPLRHENHYCASGLSRVSSYRVVPGFCAAVVSKTRADSVLPSISFDEQILYYQFTPYLHRHGL